MPVRFARAYGPVADLVAGRVAAVVRVIDVPASIEEDLVPLAVLHDMLRRVGLLRLARGVLTPTRAATDDLEIVRRLRSWFEPEIGFRGILAGLVGAALAASGPMGRAELAERVYSLLGVGWAVGGSAASELTSVRPGRGS